MNIKTAKKQIKDTVSVYLEKDSFGGYIIPTEKQRPIFVMGAPGIGKTAIMEQVASELGIALVSYSMTHHTRQSALGLPFIVQKNYDGEECSVSEYTMSEIISSVYETIEKSGRKEGILFLDEINCVSETLAPSMLQFLQFKTFGRHRVPEGWVVVTAGNPPEYNNSVREFDIATWDRLKRMDIEPDLQSWKEYAYTAGVHPSIITYLEIKKKNFYVVESTVDGKQFVTARGWEDLSRIMTLYEKRGLEIDETLVNQYVQHRKIAGDFAAYYYLFNKYRSDYQIDSILAGNASDEIKERAKAAKFDERISLLGLITDSLTEKIKEIIISEKILTQNVHIVKTFAEQVEGGQQPTEVAENLLRFAFSKLDAAKAANALTEEQKLIYMKIISMIENYRKIVAGSHNAYEDVKNSHNMYAIEMKSKLLTVKKSLSNVFSFIEQVFGEANEMIIFVAEFTTNPYCAEFVKKYGCDEYFKYSKTMMFHERYRDIADRIKNAGENGGF